MSALKTLSILVLIASISTTIAVADGPQKNEVTDAKELTARIAELEEIVSGMTERRKIQKVYENYGHGIDRLDEEAYRKAFWPDAQINYGTRESITPEQHWQGHMQNAFKAYGKAWAHLLTNQSIDLNGDVAHVETYLTVMFIPKETGGRADRQSIWAGRYIDKLERRHGEWRIAVREYMPHFAMKADTSAYDMWQDKDYFAGATSNCAQQAAGRHDVAYARPLKRRDRAAGPACAQ